MPLYEYQCIKCDNEFTILRDWVERNSDDTRCPECGAPAERKRGGFNVKVYRTAADLESDYK